MANDSSSPFFYCHTPVHHVQSNSAFFISDAHFGIDMPGYEDRDELFFRFLEQKVMGASELYIVGDLFDFWVEYRNAIRPDYFQVLYHLKKISDGGTAVHYLAGNHDFALGPFLHDTMGFAIYPGALSITIQGKRLYLYHGDGLAQRDLGYRLLKKLLRNPVNQRIYKFLHPDLGVTIGSFISGSSRKYLNKELSKEIRNEYRECAHQELQRGHDIVMYGHIHQPDLVRFTEGIYCNIGSWLKHYTYATMTGGTFSLMRFRDGAEPQELTESDLK
jgi:UDP-2,3-diacylglucosamine hydrolase